MKSIPTLLYILGSHQEFRSLRGQSNGPHPVCHICSCDSCDDDGFNMQTPHAVWTLPTELQHMTGMENISCSILQDQDLRGFVPPEVCADDVFRLIPSFREDCGCPTLPAPTSSPTPAPTKSPTPELECQGSWLFCLFKRLQITVQSRSSEGIAY